jgi:hypothetical protein
MKYTEKLMEDIKYFISLKTEAKGNKKRYTKTFLKK